MNNPLQFYTTEKEQLTTQLQKLKSLLNTNSILRLLLFLGIIASIFIAVKYSFWLFIGSIIIACFFTFFILKHSKLQYEKKLVQAKININETEIAVLNRKYEHLETGEEFNNPAHFYSNDIDLFGIGSFFQYLNRTQTTDGKQLLADVLTENSYENITTKQDALKELANKIQWRQHFTAVSSLISNSNSTKSILNWIINYSSLLPNSLKNIGKIFPLISLILITLIGFKIFPFSILIIWFIIGLSCTGSYLKNINKLYDYAGKSKEVFKQYHLLLELIENQTFQNHILKEKQRDITLENRKASAIFKRFSKTLDAFDQRNNIIIAVLGNGLFLWDIQNAVKTENWIEQYQSTVQKWFDVIHFFDAQNSLANFVYNHPNYSFPSILKEEQVIRSQDLAHPLLNPKTRVVNNFAIENNQIFIVTGANMAGKSTFLRTVSLSVVMANCGLPVCATSYAYYPTKLISSMRTSDSLNKDESYFYSELKRLKFIVDEIDNDHYLIILDEILKGTNSKDKALGSAHFIEKLTKLQSTAIIATHDVSLCELSEKYNTIKNYFFEAEITNDELFFDYKMKQGICKNMNASFLLKKMGIV